MPLVGPDIGKRLHRIGAAVQTGSTVTLRDAARAAKDIQESFIRSATGDMRLSGVGRRGARVGVTTTVRGDTVLVRATGPMHLIERDTSGHMIRSRYARKGGGRRAVINIPGVGYRRSARHPGTRGKHPFERGQVAARPVVTRIIRRRTTNIISAAM